MLSRWIASPFVILFSAIAAGLLLGAVRVAGVSLGAAGVFFVALAFGHFGLVVPRELTEFGLLLFVYAIGLQSGARFFDAFRSRGLAFLVIGAGSTAAAGLMCIALAVGLNTPAEIAAGVLCGATTCTPALAATLDVVAANSAGFSAATSVGYGAAYPFSIIAVVVYVQLLPRLLRRDASVAAAEFEAEQLAKTPPLESLVFQITNPNLGGLRVREFNELRLFDGVLARVRRGDLILPAQGDLVLQVGDAIKAVATPSELAKLEAVVGNVVAATMDDPRGVVTTELVVVSRREAIGRAIRELGIRERYGVVLTRIRRDELEFTPRPEFVLQVGDALRVVGLPDDIRAFTDAVGRESRRLSETSLVPFALGIVLGVLIGMIPIHLPGGVDVRLGLGGGAFVAGLLLGRFGGVRPLPLHVPVAVSNFARDLGLVAFLAGAGSAAGQSFVEIVQQSGPTLFALGAAVTTAMLGAATMLIFALLRWNLLAGAGAACACMTNPAGLSAANQLAASEAPAVGFASVYPVALLSKIVMAPIIYLVLSKWFGL